MKYNLSIIFNDLKLENKFENSDISQYTFCTNFKYVLYFSFGLFSKNFLIGVFINDTICFSIYFFDLSSKS